MRVLQVLMAQTSKSPKRTFTFEQAGLLQQFLQNYRMKLDKLLKAFSMDENCQNKCATKDMKHFGMQAQGCQARCKLNMERVLTQAERTVILYSMIYVERENLHPDVREHLWMRSSGAH